MKCAALSALLVFGCTLYGAEKQERDTENAMLAAYSNLQYSEARRLAAKSDRPEFKLISALCDVFDRRTQNLKRGMPELERLSKSQELPERYRSMAKLAYARANHTLALRERVYKDAGKVNPVPIYEEIITTYPESLESISAVVYRAQYFMEERNFQEAIQFTENFINSYKGKNRRLLCPLHLMLKDFYILCFRDYKNAMRHAKIARELRPANPRMAQRLDFQIARIYDVYLKDDVNAENEYLSFIEKHPDTSEATPAKRYLKELRERKAKK